MEQWEKQNRIIDAYAYGRLKEYLMTKKRARKRKPNTSGSGIRVNDSVLHLALPSWYGINDLRPDTAGLYLIIGHEGKAIGGRMIQTVYAPNQMTAHFEDMSGERIGLHCIKSVYGPIPEENPNG